MNLNFSMVPWPTLTLLGIIKNYESLKKCYGNTIKPQIAESKKNMEKLTKANLEKIGNEFNEICTKLTNLLKQNFTVDSPEVQALIKQHYEWIKKFWRPDQESYIGLGKGYTEPAWQKTFAPYNAELAPFLAHAMEVFAQKEL